MKKSVLSLSVAASLGGMGFYPGYTVPPVILQRSPSLVAVSSKAPATKEERAQWNAKIVQHVRSQQ